MIPSTTSFPSPARLRAALTGVALAAASALAAAAPPSYHLIDLGPYTDAWSVDAAGDVLGRHVNATRGYAVWHAADGTWLDLRNPNGVASINDRGRVAGSTWGSTGQTAAWWDTDGRIHRPDTGGATYSGATAIAENGTVIGWTNTWPEPYRTVQWVDGVRTDLGCLPHAVGCFPHGTSPRGTLIAGEAQIDDDHVVAVIHRPSGWIRLGTLGGKRSAAYGVNASGHATGWSTLGPDGRSHAFRWDGASLHDLGAPADADTLGLAIAANDDVVGYTFLPSGAREATLWQGDTAYALSSLVVDGAGWTLWTANDINDAGVIVGTGILDGATHGYVLVPLASQR